jgi:DDE superfamily endonuclease
MDQATQLWTWWLSLLSAFAPAFTRPGWVRFVQWVTGMVLAWEEHTITQILTALGLEERWRVLEHFAEYGAWDRESVERHTRRLLEQERPVRWGQYHPVALDDTKLHRTSKRVWGTCTFHEASARSPNRAETVRAHNWVVMGDLQPGRPWTYLPHGARLYCRQTQLPAGETFRTKTALAVDLLRQADTASAAPLLAIFDGPMPWILSSDRAWSPRETSGRSRSSPACASMPGCTTPWSSRLDPRAAGPCGDRVYPPPTIMCTGRSAGSGAGPGSMAGCAPSGTNSSGVAGR